MMELSPEPEKNGHKFEVAALLALVAVAPAAPSLVFAFAPEIFEVVYSNITTVAVAVAFGAIAAVIAFAPEVVDVVYSKIYDTVTIAARVTVAVANLITNFKSPQSISPAPGSAVLRISEFIFSKKTHDHIFRQAIADMRDEHNDALLANRKFKARWVVIRGYLALGWTLALLAASAPVKLIKALWA